MTGSYFVGVSVVYVDQDCYVVWCVLAVWDWNANCDVNYITPRPACGRQDEVMGHARPSTPPNDSRLDCCSCSLALMSLMTTLWKLPAESLVSTKTSRIMFLVRGLQIDCPSLCVCLHILSWHGMDSDVLNLQSHPIGWICHMTC